MARMKSRLFNTVGFSMVVISARSLVIFPLSIVAIVADVYKRQVYVLYVVVVIQQIQGTVQVF